MFNLDKNNDGIRTNLSGETKQRILEILLEGPMSLGEITDKLQIQKSAVRVHLESLQAEKAVESHFKIERLGRPRKIYHLTENGRELFPRKYDQVLSLILKKISETNGQEQAKKLVESVADDIAASIRYEIEKSGSSGNFEESLKILNSISNAMGFASYITKEDDNKYSIQSKNCILHKVAVDHQNIICHGLHDRMIIKSLYGDKNEGKKRRVSVELKQCIALGDSFSRHTVTNIKN
ncbi:MAG TPA: ArsR family transcriptional regulator [Nitrososphaeraceae archaeon]|nr:ArsR family transcriptional regulator [Nitrososphaeraceae archaeon]